MGETALLLPRERHRLHVAMVSLKVLRFDDGMLSSWIQCDGHKNRRKQFSSPHFLGVNIYQDYAPSWESHNATLKIPDYNMLRTIQSSKTQTHQSELEDTAKLQNGCCLQGHYPICLSRPNLIKEISFVEAQSGKSETSNLLAKDWVIKESEFLDKRKFAVWVF